MDARTRLTPPMPCSSAATIGSRTSAPATPFGSDGASRSFYRPYGGLRASTLDMAARTRAAADAAKVAETKEGPISK